MGAGGNVVAGKMSMADVAVLGMYIMCTDSLIKAEKELSESAPAALKIVEKLKENPKYAAVIKEAQEMKWIF